MENVKQNKTLPKFNIPVASSYSLKDAARIAGCSPQDILHFGARGKIALLAKVHRCIRVRPYETPPSGHDYNGLTPAFYNLSPAFLVLFPSYCIQIELNGKTEQGDFQECYVELDQNLKKKQPSDFDEYFKFKDKNIFWRTYQNDFDKKLELTTECLFVMHDDLMQLIENEVNPFQLEIAPIKKLYYSIEDAASMVGCELNSIVEYAAQGKICLMTGVPCDVHLDAYNGERKVDWPIFSQKPQLLVLMRSNDSGDNILDKFQLSGFPEGYCVDSAGQMRKVFPCQSHSELNNQSFWRAFQDDEPIKELELTTKYLFVSYDDLEKLFELSEVTVNDADKSTTKELATRAKNERQTVITIAEVVKVEEVDNHNKLFDEISSQKESMPDAIIDVSVAAKSSEFSLVDSDNSNNPSASAKGLNENYYKMEDVLMLTSKSRATINNWIEQCKTDEKNSFPKPVKIGKDRKNYWDRDKFVFWLKNHYLNSK